MEMYLAVTKTNDGCIFLGKCRLPPSNDFYDKYYTNKEPLPLIQLENNWYIKVQGIYKPETQGYEITFRGETFFLTDSDRVRKIPYELFILGKFEVEEKKFYFYTRTGAEILSVEAYEVHTVNIGDDEPIFVRGLKTYGEAWDNNIWRVYWKNKIYFINSCNISCPAMERRDTLTKVVYTIGATVEDYKSTSVTENDAKVVSTSTFKLDPDSERVDYASGAQRSAAVKHFRYDLIHPLFAKALARVLAEGAEKYGEHNWELGFPISSLTNHLFAHLYDFMSGDRSEDHLGHAACNMMFLLVEAELRYEQNRDQLRLENCQLSPEMIQVITKFQEARKNKVKEKTHSNEDRIHPDSRRAITTKVLKLFNDGTLRYQAGCWIPFKDFVRLYFNEFSYTNVRRVFADLNIEVDENDHMFNKALKES